MKDLSRLEVLKGMLFGAGALAMPSFASKLTAEEDPYDKITVPSDVKTVIYINMAGGMSHIDTLDPKSNQTPFRKVNSAIKGAQVGEPFARIGRELGNMNLIRATWSEDGDHGFGQRLVNTGYRITESAGFPDLPSMGSMVAYAKKRYYKGPYFPSCVTIGQRNGFIGRSGFLGVRYTGFHIGNLDKPVNYLQPSWGRLSSERFVRREQFLDMLNSNFQKKSASTELAVWNDMYESAVDFMNSEKLAAFDIDKEPAARRSKFGNTWAGKACLMAYRLAKEEVPFVQITIGGWDTHNNNKGKISDIMKDADPAIAALLGELRSSGLVDQTIFMLSSEFGRTPDVGERDGRDHYPSVWTTILGGGSLPRGEIIGQSDAKGKKPLKETEAYHFRDVTATMYYAAGVDPEAQLETSTGRPFFISPKKAKLIDAML